MRSNATIIDQASERIAACASDRRTSSGELIAIAAGIWKARALYAAAKLRFADLIGDGAASAEDLARATGMHAPSLRRLMRMLASLGILAETESAHYRLTGVGAALKEGAPGSARAAILTLAGDWQWKAWDNMLHSLRTGETAMRESFGLNLFDYLAAHPQAGADFDEAMLAIHGGDGADVTAAYDFSGLRTVVDVGGGTGALLSAILAANPHLHGVLYERPQTVPRARALIRNCGLAARCEVRAGDFFLNVPEGHDAYLLSHILHDWSDEQALPILRNCRRAIGPEGRLLILEAVLPEDDTPHPGKMMDLLMLTVTGGLERTGSEYAQLLARAGFRVGGIIALASDQSIVEALPAVYEEY
jgi:SAM-dependent methyltransferase